MKNLFIFTYYIDQSNINKCIMNNLKFYSYLLISFCQFFLKYFALCLFLKENLKNLFFNNGITFKNNYI